VSSKVGRLSPSGISRWRSSACGTLARVRELPFRPESVEVLLFDLGGVVIDIDFRRCFAHWAHSADRDVEELASHFSIDSAYEAHECGRLPISEYLEHLRRTLTLALTDDELLAGWNDIWTGVNADIGPLLTLASDAFPLYAFTNSNPTHQAVWSQHFAEPLGIFTSTFVSSEIGHRKPERAAFDHVASMIGALPESTLFFDDGRENVTGAREAGMQAVHVTSTDMVRNALARLGVTEYGTSI
jgi:glucose-1-phosphatase